MDTINYNGKEVILNENHNNSAISIHLLGEEEMRKIGFTDYAKDRWYYCKRVADSITFNITIPKEHSENWRIDILDENFCQPYDYQYMLMNGSQNNAVKTVAKNVEKEVQHLAECGIICGHEYGDYI